MINIIKLRDNEQAVLADTKSQLIAQLKQVPEFPGKVINDKCIVISASELGNNWSAEYHSKAANERVILSFFEKAKSISELVDGINRIISSGKCCEKPIHPLMINFLKSCCEASE